MAAADHVMISGCHNPQKIWRIVSCHIRQPHTFPLYERDTMAHSRLQIRMGYASSQFFQHQYD